MIRHLLKASVEGLLGGAVAESRIRRRGRDDLLVLAFHNVVPDDSAAVGDRPLHLKLSIFTEIIDRLLELCTPTALGSTSERDDRPRFAVTFDDAYRGALTLALPALALRQVPAHIFVPTALIGDRDFWWDAVADPARGLLPDVRRHALEQLRGDDELIRQWAVQAGGPPRRMSAEWRSATVEELRAAVRLPDVFLAPHTATHRTLDLLEERELRHELLAPLTWFEDQQLPYSRILTYPYGRWSQTARELAAEVGYEGAWLVSGGWSGHPAADPMVMPRLNVSAGASRRGTMLRIADLVPW